MSPPRSDHWLDRLAMRLADSREPTQPLEPFKDSEPGIPTSPEAGITRGSALKAFGAGAAVAVFPFAWRASPAEAARDCYQPCLGIVGEAVSRDLRKCEPRPGDFPLAFTAVQSIHCLLSRGDRLVASRRECAKPDCGRYGKIIKEGGTIGSVPVPPLELPAGTKAECDNCRSAGGYCGVCAAGTVSPDQSFFCGTPGVPPSRYCGGG